MGEENDARRPRRKFSVEFKRDAVERAFALATSDFRRRSTLAPSVPALMSEAVTDTSALPTPGDGRGTLVSVTSPVLGLIET